MDVEIIVPVSFFLMIAGIAISGFYFNSLNRRSLDETLRSAFAAGEAPSLELVNAIRKKVRPKKADLRRGVILLGFAAGLLALGLIPASMDGDAGRVGLVSTAGVAAMPALIGLAYIVLHFITPDDEL